MDKKELNKAIEKTVLKMALEPKNTDHYHELAKYYAMDNQYVFECLSLSGCIGSC